MKTLLVALMLFVTAPVGAQDWNPSLWRDLVFGDPPAPQSGVLPRAPTDVNVVVQEHDLTGVCSRHFRDCETYRAAYDRRRADIRDVLERVSLNVFGEPWTGALVYERWPKQTAGRLTVVVDGTDPNVCATAYLGATAGLVTLGYGCPAMGLDQPTAFRAVLAHEVGHSLGFFHDSIPNGLMNPVLHMNNLPTEERPAVQAEVLVARCAYRLSADRHPILLDDYPGDVVPPACADLYDAAVPVPAVPLGVLLAMATVLGGLGLRCRRR